MIIILLKLILQCSQLFWQYILLAARLQSFLCRIIEINFDI